MNVFTVEFSSRWYLCTQKSPSLWFPQHCLWNGSSVYLTDKEDCLALPLSLLQAVNGVMSLALCIQVVSQASQHFRAFKKQTTCEGCFAHQSICSVVSHHSSMSRAVQPQEFSKVDVNHWHIPVWASLPLFVASSLNLWGWRHVWSVTSWSGGRCVCVGGWGGVIAGIWLSPILSCSYVF